MTATDARPDRRLVFRRSVQPRDVLARRIDFETARALEWRAGRLEPLDGAERVEARLDSSGEVQAPATLVVDRAQALLGRPVTTPGRLTESALGALTLVLVVLALVAGWQVARLALSASGSEPVNIAWFLAYSLGLQSLLLVLSLVAMLPALPGRSSAGRWLSRHVTLGSLVVSGAVRLGALLRRRADGIDSTEIVARLKGLGALRPLLLATSHGAWAAFNVAFLVASVLILSAEHHSFAWQSTFIKDEAHARQALQVLTWPASVWPGAPTAEQVHVSRYDPEREVFLHEIADPDRALALRQAWSTQLLASVAGWALLPRLALLGVTLVGWRRARLRLAPSSADPYVEAVLDRVTSVRTSRTMEAERARFVEPTPGPPPSARVLEEESRPLTWHVTAWLDAAPGQTHADDPVRALWGGPRRGWHPLPRLESRRSEAQALEVLSERGRGTGLVVLCDYHTTPDAALGRCLQGMRDALGPGAPLVVLLTGGDAFRQSRMGGRPGGAEERRRVWTEFLARWGVAASHVIDFDPRTATPASRHQLADRLGAAEQGDAPGPDAAAALDGALDDVAASAPRWLDELQRTPAAEREACQLRLAATARRAVDARFDALARESAEGSRLGSALAAPVASSLRRALRLPDDLDAEALGAAAREVARMGRLLTRIRDVDPRFVVAGLTAGLVAGPLGGAIAAGTAGLVAGASLISTLGPLGAAIGGATSLRLSREEPGPDAEADVEEPAAELLGLPARTAVTRAVVLANQGRSEPEIAELLAALNRTAAARALLVTADDVTALVEEARAIARPS